MPSADLVLPKRMSRVAVVAPVSRTREALVALAGLGTVELAGTLPPGEGEAVEALHRVRRVRGLAPAEPAVLDRPPDVAALERAGESGLLEGEVEIARRTRMAVPHGSFAAWVGWAPTDALGPLNDDLGRIGAAAVELAPPAWVEPPTLLSPVKVEQPFRPLVQSYGTTPYGDIDPTAFTIVSFVVMFGIMFGDVGHGLVLVLLSLWLRRRKKGRFAAFRGLWVIPFAAGLAGMFFGFLYGECFGPTGLVPTLWLDPLEEPVTLLVVALAIGVVLLTISYVLGIVNRWRHFGLREALLAQFGVAGLSVFVGGLILAGGVYSGLVVLQVAGAVVATVGVVLLAVGLVLEAGHGATALTQVAIELFDAVVRLFSNLVSFTRLAAFGLMHAALGLVVFEAASALWGGPVGVVLGTLVFVVGNTATFALEALVTGVQALRLEYYELYSRIFSGEGHAFAPWALPVRRLTPLERDERRREAPHTTSSPKEAS
jgi:V/A-type H+-transporting ATPase subunit I